MKIFHKFLPLVLSALLILSLAACGEEEAPDDSLSIGDDTEQPVTDMAFLDVMWSVEGMTKLYFNSEGGYYAYREERTCRGGQGAFSDVNGRPMIEFNGLLYGFLLRDDGVLLPDRNGESGNDSDYTINRFTFSRDDEAEFLMCDDSNWDGMWQNAAGETIVIDTSRGQYIAASPKHYSGGTVGNNNDGMGFYLYDNGERAYICAGSDGNSFRLIGGNYSYRYSGDGHWDGVFYRDGNIEAYTDPSQTKFTDQSEFIWYFDGVSTYGLGYNYKIGDDGLAYFSDDGLIFPAGWIPEQPYNPADNWGEDWMNNWD